jgi:hypothetical protein
MAFDGDDNLSRAARRQCDLPHRRRRPEQFIIWPTPASKAMLGMAARLAGPKGLARVGGRLFVADTERHVIRSIALDTGIITTVVGTGQRGDGPEPNPLQCALSRPHCIFVDRDDALYVLDSEAHRIRVLI